MHTIKVFLYSGLRTEIPALALSRSLFPVSSILVKMEVVVNIYLIVIMWMWRIIMVIEVTHQTQCMCTVNV